MAADHERRFPVLSHTGLTREERQLVAEFSSVPWEFVAAHEAQAQRNHSQSVQRLAERGGLSPWELWCVVTDHEWPDEWWPPMNGRSKALPPLAEMLDRLRVLVTEWEARVSVTPPSPALAVAAAERAVEEAWRFHRQEDPQAIEDAVADWIIARRAAQAAGYIGCWVSREAVEAFKVAQEQGGCSPDLVDDFMDLLARDLAALLKEPAK